VFTVVRLIDTTLDNMQHMGGIARIRGYYRTLTPEAAKYFAANIVAGAGVTLLANALLGGDHIGLALALGICSTIALTLVFLVYQRWRFRTIDLAVRGPESNAFATVSKES
jgi:hypothetical protein